MLCFVCFNYCTQTLRANPGDCTSYYFRRLTLSVTPVNDPEEIPTATDSILRLWLSPQVVNNQKPVSNTFYVWITSDELDSVVSQKRLLRTSAPSNHIEELYWQKLLGTIKYNELISNHLRSGDKQRIREAWPNYWSTLSESYPQSSQNQLVKVVLMDSALIIVFNPDNRKARWSVRDLDGNLISINAALQRKRHIAAVFFSGKNNDAWSNTNTVNSITPTYIKRKEYYRSFILCNEEMIKSWHHAVPGVQAQILNDLNYLLLLNAYLGEGSHQQGQGNKGINVRDSWVKPIDKMRVSQMFFATQRLAWQGGVPATQQSITNIINILRERWPNQSKPVERYPASH